MKIEVEDDKVLLFQFHKGTIKTANQIACIQVYHISIP